MPGGFVCSKCREPLPESSSRCGNCGYAPAKEYNRKKWLYGVVGFVLTVSVIGVPIGLPLLWFGYRNRKKAEKATPVVSA